MCDWRISLVEVVVELLHEGPAEVDVILVDPVLGLEGRKEEELN